MAAMWRMTRNTHMYKSREVVSNAQDTRRDEKCAVGRRATHEQKEGEQPRRDAVRRRAEAPTFRGRVPNSSIQSGRLSFTASKVRPQPLQASMASRRSWPSYIPDKHCTHIYEAKRIYYKGAANK